MVSKTVKKDVKKDLRVPELCPRCHKGILLTSYDEKICSNFCGYSEVIIKDENQTKHQVPPLEEISVKPFRRIHGISAAESRRIYRNSPAGKAAWERYRRSPLFSEAHARHRKTQKYRDTQRRYHDKQKLYKTLYDRLNGNLPPESTCPLNLFYKGSNGEVYHDLDKCDFDGKDCGMGCIGNTE